MLGRHAPLKAEEVFRLHQQVPEWDVTSGRKLVRRFEFEDFAEAAEFVNRVADPPRAKAITRTSRSTTAA